MTQRLATTSPDFAAAFTTLVDARREADEDVSRDVTAILKAVRAGGDAALADYTQRFDRHDLNVSGWAVTPAECRAALEGISTTLRDALELAAARIKGVGALGRQFGQDHGDVHAVGRMA